MKNFFDQYFLKKKSCEIFFIGKNSDLFFWNVPKDVLKSLLRGPKITKKKYWVVFEIFPKRKFFHSFFFPENQKLRNFFIGKISDLFFLEYSKTCLKTSTKGTKNNEKKILSSFREIREILAKIFTKKGDFDFGEIFWKREHSDFFFENIPNDVEKHH